MSAEQVEIANLPLIIYEVNGALMDAVIGSLSPEFSYHICFDELDRGFDIKDENYKYRLIGLLIAARDFNKKLRVAGKKMSVVVFLRDDILRYLKFEDKNKIIDDFSTTIEWDKAVNSRSLKDLMSKRFAKLLSIDEETAWDRVFDESIRMPGQQTKYQHMRDRTFKRPRDMIKYSNEILKYHNQSKSGAAKFENSDVIGARVEHSKYMRKELVDEMHQHFPQEEYAFDILKTIGHMSFTINAFLERHADLSRKVEGLPTASIVLRQLHAFSAIGFLKVGGAGGGSEWVWRYEDTDADYDERATVFRTHPALKENLGLKQGRAHGKNEEVVETTDGPFEAELDCS